MVRFAWLFPGQGSQVVGMACDVARTSVCARAVFERADEALGEPLSKLIENGPEEELTLTANAQPAILVASIALLEALRERCPDLPEPSVLAGHSLGEYTALVVAGALSLEDAIRLVHLRGKAMQGAVPAGTGTMAAIVAMDNAGVEAVCAEVADNDVVSPANFNAPGQVVIAGHVRAVERASAKAVERGGRVFPLRVSAPFHCALMQPAADAMADALSKVAISGTRSPVLSNVDGLPHADASSIRRRLIAQMTSPVQWEQTLRTMGSMGITHTIEVGPGDVLSGCVKRTLKGVVPLSVRDEVWLTKTMNALATLANS